MRLSITHNGNPIVDFNQVQVFGRSALGGYAISFILKGIACHYALGATVTNISLTLSAGSGGKPICSFIPSSCQFKKFNNAGTEEQLHFEIVFSQSQLNSIEDYRKDGDLHLGIGLKAVTLLNDQGSDSCGIDTCIIQRQQWLEALKLANARNTLLFEIPLPYTESGLSNLIAKAQEFIETGHYKDAVMQCRHIVEQVELIRGDKKESGAANAKAHGNERKDMSSIERLLSLREQLKNVCQLGAHGSEDFTRSQAKAVLGATLALLSEPTIGFLPEQE